MKKLSPWEEMFALHVRIHKLPPPLRNFSFCASRDWRTDFAWPAHDLLVEIEGGVWIIGRHQRPQGFLNDIEKYNAATVDGWRVLRFSPDMVKNEVAIKTVSDLIAGRAP